MTKLKSHLLRASACRRTLLGRCLSVEPAPGAGSTIDTARARAHDGILPPLQGAGPALPPDRMDEIDPYDLALMEEIYLALVNDESLLLSEELVRKVIEQTPVSWCCCRETLIHMEKEVTEEDIAVLAEHRRDLRQTLQHLQHPEAWHFLRDAKIAGDCPRRDLPFMENVLEQRMKDCHDPSWPVHRPMAKVRF